MSTLTHIPKLTRTACGKLITPRITLRNNPMDYVGQYYSSGHCRICAFSEFTSLWRRKIADLKMVFWKRFGNCPEDDLVMDAAHKKTIEEYQNKGFNV